MIIFKTESKFDQPEIEIASKNLPNNFYMNMEIKYKDAIHSASHFWMFPYSGNDYTSCENNYYAYYTNTHYAWCIESKSDETVEIELNKIPIYYDYMDIYLIGYEDTKIGFNITFNTTPIDISEYLFGYQYNFNKASEINKGNVLIGTFARVTNGWKFYPKFTETLETKQNIVKKYADL